MTYYENWKQIFLERLLVPLVASPYRVGSRTYQPRVSELSCSSLLGSSYDHPTYYNRKEDAQSVCWHSCSYICPINFCAGMVFIRLFQLWIGCRFFSYITLVIVQYQMHILRKTFNNFSLSLEAKNWWAKSSPRFGFYKNIHSSCIFLLHMISWACGKNKDQTRIPFAAFWKTNGSWKSCRCGINNWTIYFR